VVIGTLVGVIAGYAGGAVGAVLMRLVDVALVIPFVPLMVLLAAYLGQSLWNLIVVIGLLIWARPARIIRSHVLTLARQDYILAARALGLPGWRIVFHHVMPGVFSLALAQFVLAASASMLLESSLSFLGLGDPTQKSWGTMLFYAQTRSAFLSGAWQWWVVPPGLMITGAVLGFALIGFALEEITSPKVQRQSAPTKPMQTKAPTASLLPKPGAAPTTPEK
jgi:peptide/nickel transport system permease protein